HACHSDAPDYMICPLVVQARVGPCVGVASGRAAGAWQTHRNGGVTSDGAQPGGAVSEVSPRAQSGAMVECGGGPRAPWLGGGHVRTHPPRGHLGRRYGGTAAGREDPEPKGPTPSRPPFPVSYCK